MTVTMDGVDEEADVDSDEDDAHARAQVAMACSTTAEIAPRRPPKTEEADDEDEVDEETDVSDGDRGGATCSPRYISSSSLSSSERWSIL